MVYYGIHAIILTAIVLLAIAFLFSAYPNYIKQAKHGNVFGYGQKFGNEILEFLGLDNEIDDRWNSEKYIFPKKINQPFLLSFKAEDLPNEIYYNKNIAEYLYHSPMMPDPYTTYALLPGEYLTANNSIQQFRYNEELLEKDENEFRIFITGGSTAWGALASDNDSTIAGYLEKILNEQFPLKNIKVITAAAGAWNSTQERIWIFNRITEYEPDIIISYSGHNDIFDQKLRHENIYDSYWFDGKYYFNSILQYEGYNRGEKILNYLLKYSSIKQSKHSDDFPKKIVKNYKIVDSYLEKIGCKFIYIFQPIRQKERKSVERLITNLINSFSKLAQRSPNMTVLDHSRIFDGKDHIFYDRCHFGDIGNKIIAYNLIELLSDEMEK